MPFAQDVFVNLRVVRKALERIEKSLGKEAVKRYFPKARDWLEGKATPTFRQIEQLAQKALLPLGLFFLEEVSEPELSYVYFRAKGGLVEASPELEYTISKVKERQNFLSDYLKELGWEKLKIVGSIHLKQDVKEAANILRKFLGLNEGWAKQFKTRHEVFKYLRHRVEELGVFVFTNSVVDNNNFRRLDPEEFSGFSLVDDVAPVIFVNTADYLNSQIFTLMHELCHVSLGIQEQGVFAFNEMSEYTNNVEVFCNNVAAEILVPERELEIELQKRGKDYVGLADVFKVSLAVIGIRLKSLGYITQDEYDRDIKEKYDEFMDSLEEGPQRQSGGDFYLTQRKKLGDRFISILNSALEEGYIDFRDVYSLTTLGFEKFKKLVGEVYESVHT